MWFGSGVPMISAHKPRSLLFALALLAVIVTVGWGLGQLLPVPEPLYW